MKNASKNRSSLFLMELIIAILFFSLVSAVCLKLFTKAHTMGIRTSELNLCVSQAGNAAELLKSQDGNIDLLAAEYPDAVQAGSKLEIFYNKDFSLCKESDAVYYLSIQSQTTENTPGSTDSYDIDIVRSSSGKAIYHLPVTVHRAYQTD